MASTSCSVNSATRLVRVALRIRVRVRVRTRVRARVRVRVRARVRARVREERHAPVVEGRLSLPPGIGRLLALEHGLAHLG